jgi:hypothetical protein
MATKQKPQYPISVQAAADLTGYSRAWISRLCQHGKIGTRHEMLSSGRHYYSLDQQAVAWLISRKKK